MKHPNGVHHLAIATANMKQQIEFFSEVLGMELVALYWMHGVEGAWHGFMKANDKCYVAFVHLDAHKSINVEIGKTHAGNGGSPCAPGVMQHVAFNVDTEEDLLQMRDRIRSRGVNVFGPLDHGFCKSIYFAGPEQLSLEIATSREAINPKAWIDPEVVTLAGISSEDLKRYRAPAEYSNSGPKIEQPKFDASKPHMNYPRERYAAMLGMTDEQYSAFSMPDPPIKVA